MKGLQLHGVHSGGHRVQNIYLVWVHSVHSSGQIDPFVVKEYEDFGASLLLLMFCFVCVCGGVGVGGSLLVLLVTCIANFTEILTLFHSLCNAQFYSHQLSELLKFWVIIILNAFRVGISIED